MWLFQKLVTFRSRLTKKHHQSLVWKLSTQCNFVLMQESWSIYQQQDNLHLPSTNNHATILLCRKTTIKLTNIHFKPQNIKFFFKTTYIRIIETWRTVKTNLIKSRSHERLIRHCSCTMSSNQSKVLYHKKNEWNLETASREEAACWEEASNNSLLWESEDGFPHIPWRLYDLDLCQLSFAGVHSFIQNLMRLSI